MDMLEKYGFMHTIQENPIIRERISKGLLNRMLMNRMHGNYHKMQNWISNFSGKQGKGKSWANLTKTATHRAWYHVYIEGQDKPYLDYDDFVYIVDRIGFTTNEFKEIMRIVVPYDEATFDEAQNEERGVGYIINKAEQKNYINEFRKMRVDLTFCAPQESTEDIHTTFEAIGVVGTKSYFFVLEGAKYALGMCSFSMPPKELIKLYEEKKDAHLKNSQDGTGSGMIKEIVKVAEKLSKDAGFLDCQKMAECNLYVMEHTKFQSTSHVKLIVTKALKLFYEKNGDRS